MTSGNPGQIETCSQDVPVSLNYEYAQIEFSLQEDTVQASQNPAYGQIEFSLQEDTVQASRNPAYSLIESSTQDAVQVSQNLRWKHLHKMMNLLYMRW